MAVRMLVRDHQKRTVPRASGLCETYGEVAAFHARKAAFTLVGAITRLAVESAGSAKSFP